ncbi:MAG: hypothetical protein KAW41_06875 [Candidatus Diapherotrites archaeon]|nr:hypothetical protein [Candidatus Diapherotrites archaeon]
MTGKIDQYLCGEDMDEALVLPKHYEEFFDKSKLMKTLLVLTALLLIGGAAWL